MIPGLMSRLSESIVASTTTVTIKSDLVTMTGTTAVATIVPPPGQGGQSTVIFIVPVDGSIATTTAGNIAKAVTMVQNQTCVFTYSKQTAKWYPGAIS